MRFILICLLFASCASYKVGSCYYTGWGAYKFKVIGKREDGYYKILRKDGRIYFVKPALYDVYEINCKEEEE